MKTCLNKFFTNLVFFKQFNPSSWNSYLDRPMKPVVLERKWCLKVTQHVSWEGSRGTVRGKEGEWAKHGWMDLRLCCSWDWNKISPLNGEAAASMEVLGIIHLPLDKLAGFLSRFSFLFSFMLCMCIHVCEVYVCNFQEIWPFLSPWLTSEIELSGWFQHLEPYSSWQNITLFHSFLFLWPEVNGNIQCNLRSGSRILTQFPMRTRRTKIPLRQGRKSGTVMSGQNTCYVALKKQLEEISDLGGGELHLICPGI